MQDYTIVYSVYILCTYTFKHVIVDCYMLLVTGPFSKAVDVQTTVIYSVYTVCRFTFGHGIVIQKLLATAPLLFEKTTMFSASTVATWVEPFCLSTTSMQIRPELASK